MAWHGTARHRMASRRIISYDVTPRHVTLLHVTSRHVTSRHVTSHHVTSHHITRLYHVSHVTRHTSRAACHMSHVSGQNLTHQISQNENPLENVNRKSTMISEVLISGVQSFAPNDVSLHVASSVRRAGCARVWLGWPGDICICIYIYIYIHIYIYICICVFIFIHTFLRGQGSCVGGPPWETSRAKDSSELHSRVHEGGFSKGCFAICVVLLYYYC